MLSDITMLTSCTCPGHEIVFECIIIDDGAATIWQGTALEECDNGILLLRHSQFNESYGYSLNRICGTIGQVTGRAVSAENQIYISQLILNFSQSLNGSTVQCGSVTDLVNNFFSAVLMSSISEDPGTK